jgi:hypothetical protein
MLASADMPRIPKLLMRLTSNSVFLLVQILDSLTGLVVQKTLFPPVDSLIMRTSPPLKTQPVTLGTAESTS